MSEQFLDEQHKPNRLVSPHGQVVHSEPHGGHHGTSFEGGDARAGIIIKSLALIAVMLVVVFAITIGIQKILEQRNPPGQLPSPLAPARTIPSGPLLQVHPWEELPQVKEDAQKLLNSSGVDADGRRHIPINQAMSMVAGQLTIAPNAPQGITTPGGEGRNFSGSVNSMPAPYRRPQIQGEIQKHAR
ncbi:MAG TPA: hypothetical protein VH302_06920 [Bryobacteraceae bacterium]|nr:hypothetical protein [Bryobacteraceae bacterium]